MAACGIGFAETNTRRAIDKYLDSKDARRRLTARAKPYFRAIEHGLHLGYRRLANGAAGPWIARHYLGDQRYAEEAIGHADDLSDADGVAILTYRQAVEAAREPWSYSSSTEVDHHSLSHLDRRVHVCF